MSVMCWKTARSTSFLRCSSNSLCSSSSRMARAWAGHKLWVWAIPSAQHVAMACSSMKSLLLSEETPLFLLLPHVGSNWRQKMLPNMCLLVWSMQHTQLGKVEIPHQQIARMCKSDESIVSHPSDIEASWLHELLTWLAWEWSVRVLTDSVPVSLCFVNQG